MIALLITLVTSGSSGGWAPLDSQKLRELGRGTGTDKLMTHRWQPVGSRHLSPDQGWDQGWDR